MRRVLAVAVALLLLVPPVSADGREIKKTVLQTAGGASAGLVLGGAAAFAGLVTVFCEYDCGNEDVGLALVFGSPLVFAAANAGAVHLIGRHFDGREARFLPTLGGALVGTAAGTALWFADDHTARSFVGGVALATAGTVAGYALGRQPARRIGRIEGLEVGLPTVQPRAAVAPDGKVKLGADVRLLDLRF